MRKKSIVIGLCVVLIGAGLIFGYATFMKSESLDSVSNILSNDSSEDSNTSKNAERKNPLEGKTFYVDTTRQANQQYQNSLQANNVAEAEQLNKIASQPAAIWLVGPSESDPSANIDIQHVTTTSSQAKQNNTTPVYMLYAIPDRDACAEFSKGGFATDEAYLAWVDSIIANLQTNAVFVVEADAIGHTVRTQCLDPDAVSARYSLLNQVLGKLADSEKVDAVYIDAGHSEWFPDSTVLVEPLQQSGVMKADGIVVNVSNFVETATITTWSAELLKKLGNPNLGVVIDTSRNGKGSVDASVTGDARWCNPPGRGLGFKPTTQVEPLHVDAYLWIKLPGESDGDCFGNPPAGTFVVGNALELARNAIE